MPGSTSGGPWGLCTDTKSHLGDALCEKGLSYILNIATDVNRN
jgi:hypothetical protein